MRMKVSLYRNEINQLQYPVVVEMWKHISFSGSKQRKYHAEFNENERRIIRDYYNRFYDWYLRTGTPEEVSMFPETLKLLKRAINFFGTL